MSNLLVKIATIFVGYFLPSSVVLILANLVPVYGVVYLDWGIFPIIFLYWAENIVIGFFNLLKIAFTQIIDEKKLDSSNYVSSILLSLGLKVFLTLFFCIHYGGFVLIHGIFLLALFKPEGTEVIARNANLLEISANFIKIVKIHKLELPIIILSLSHLFSFIFNFLFKKEYKKLNIVQYFALMFLPYKRIIVTHAIVILGAAIIMLYGNRSISLLILFIALKTIADLFGHYKQHRSPTQSIS